MELKNHFILYLVSLLLLDSWVCLFTLFLSCIIDRYFVQLLCFLLFHDSYGHQSTFPSFFGYIWLEDFKRESCWPHQENNMWSDIWWWREGNYGWNACKARDFCLSFLLTHSPQSRSLFFSILFIFFSSFKNSKTVCYI